MRNLPDFSTLGVRTSPKNCGFPILFRGPVSLGRRGRRDESSALLAGRGYHYWRVLRRGRSKSSASFSALAQLYYRTQERTRKEKILLAGCGKASNFGELTASLKRCPDTTLGFFLGLLDARGSRLGGRHLPTVAGSELKIDVVTRQKRFLREQIVNWSQESILVTGGTGSFGKKFVETMLREYQPQRLVVFSRDELKQHEMRTSGFGAGMRVQPV